MDNEEFLPQKALRQYRNSPVIDESQEKQIVYWKQRAKFFENKAYQLYNRLEEMEGYDSGEEWRHADD